MARSQRPFFRHTKNAPSFNGAVFFWIALLPGMAFLKLLRLMWRTLKTEGNRPVTVKSFVGAGGASLSDDELELRRLQAEGRANAGRDAALDARLTKRFQDLWAEASRRGLVDEESS